MSMFCFEFSSISVDPRLQMMTNWARALFADDGGQVYAVRFQDNREKDAKNQEKDKPISNY